MRKTVRIGREWIDGRLHVYICQCIEDERGILRPGTSIGIPTDDLDDVITELLKIRREMDSERGKTDSSGH